VPLFFLFFAEDFAFVTAAFECEMSVTCRQGKQSNERQGLYAHLGQVAFP